MEIQGEGGKEKTDGWGRPGLYIGAGMPIPFIKLG